MEDNQVKGRRKSIQQIREQVDRIVRAQYDAKKPLSAINKTIATGDKYIRNIAQSKRFADDIYSGRGVGKARSRGYSQNTYMGINAG